LMCALRSGALDRFRKHARSGAGNAGIRAALLLPDVRFARND
jgi:hypothetical protein